MNLSCQWILSNFSFIIWSYETQLVSSIFFCCWWWEEGLSTEIAWSDRSSEEMLSKAVNVICTFEYFSPARGTLRNVNDRSKRSNRALWKFLANAWQVCNGEGSFPVWVTCVTWPSTCSHHSQLISVTLSEKFFVTICICSASLVCLNLTYNLCFISVRPSAKFFVTICICSWKSFYSFHHSWF